MQSTGKIYATQVSVIAALFVAWALIGAAGLLNPAIVPRIENVAAALINVLSRPEFFPALWATLFDSLAGVLLATVVAVPLGVLIGMFPSVERATRKLLDFGRSFPVVALMPIFVLVIGANSTMKITITSIACFFPILLQTVYGARRLEPTIVDTVQSYRIPFLLRFFHVILPASAPFIATGIRIAISISILVTVGTEVIIQITGLGSQVNFARTYNEVDIAFAYTIYAGLLGVFLTALWDWFEGRILGWHHRSTAD
ncbi:MAG: ABC transporter permease [Pelagimonas sp.]|uniref:ABC transporter permease n=1 Tax=Pelagimonas sp. TaxID=2073170 RepID=UPI003D6C3DBE